MLPTETRRTLISDWNPPNKTLEREEKLETTVDQGDVQVTIKAVRDDENIIVSGIIYQRCGGGRRRMAHRSDS